MAMHEIFVFFFSFRKKGRIESVHVASPRGGVPVAQAGSCLLFRDRVSLDYLGSLSTWCNSFQRVLIIHKDWKSWKLVLLLWLLILFMTWHSSKPSIRRATRWQCYREEYDGISIWSFGIVINKTVGVVQNIIIVISHKPPPPLTGSCQRKY